MLFVFMCNCLFYVCLCVVFVRYGVMLYGLLVSSIGCVLCVCYVVMCLFVCECDLVVWCCLMFVCVVFVLCAWLVNGCVVCV